MEAGAIVWDLFERENTEKEVYETLQKHGITLYKGTIEDYHQDFKNGVRQDNQFVLECYRFHSENPGIFKTLEECERYFSDDYFNERFSNPSKKDPFNPYTIIETYNPSMIEINELGITRQYTPDILNRGLEILRQLKKL